MTHQSTKPQKKQNQVVTISDADPLRILNCLIKDYIALYVIQAQPQMTYQSP